jgi:hypothetical protein
METKLINSKEWLIKELNISFSFIDNKGETPNTLRITWWNTPVEMFVDDIHEAKLKACQFVAMQGEKLGLLNAELIKFIQL